MNKHICKNPNISIDFYDTVDLVLNILDSDEVVCREDFLKNIFLKIFNLIPEAEKGTFFDIRNNQLIPLQTIGYDINLVRQLKLESTDFLYHFDKVLNNNITAYTTYIEKRNPLQYNRSQVEIFKKLGTLKGFHSLYAPIKINNVNYCFICFENFSDGFSKDSERLLQFFSKLISQHYSQLFDRKSDVIMYQEVIKALVSAVEVKDNYTVGHAKRVSEYCEKIADELNFTTKQKERLVTAALLHDIGKIGIADNILNKPGKLTNDEYNIIKQHPEFSKKIVENITNFEDIAKIIYAHHERVDGKGYPLGLEGDAIPIESYILMVCDAYDAITSERCYKPPRPRDEAIRILRDESNKQFNSKIVDIFCKVAI